MHTTDDRRHGRIADTGMRHEDVQRTIALGTVRLSCAAGYAVQLNAGATIHQPLWRPSSDLAVHIFINY